jgi:hypothetical protein
VLDGLLGAGGASYPSAKVPCMPSLTLSGARYVPRIPHFNKRRAWRIGWLDASADSTVTEAFNGRLECTNTRPTCSIRTAQPIGPRERRTHGCYENETDKEEVGVGGMRDLRHVGGKRYPWPWPCFCRVPGKAFDVGAISEAALFKIECFGRMPCCSKEGPSA